MNEEPTGKTSIPELARELLHLPLDQVVPSNTNPRLSLAKEPFNELKQSIFANGLLQPIVVRPKGDVYEIIGGHRRFAALTDLGREHPNDKRFTRIAVVVVDVDDAMVPVLQLAENLNRSDLSPIETADGIARAVSSGIDPDQLAASLGWSKRSLNRCLQLAEAPQWLRDYAKEVKVTRKKLDTDGRVVIDARTEKAVIETDRYPGFPSTYLNELLMLYNVLRDADRIELDEAGGDRFRPKAERITRKIAAACAAEGWSTTRLRAEIRKAKDPAPQPSMGRRDARRGLQVSADRCVLDLRALPELAAEERADIAARLTETLKACGFTRVLITP